MKQLLALTNKWNNSNKEKCLKIKMLLFVFLYVTSSIGQNTPKNKKIADSLLVLTDSLVKEGKFSRALQMADRGLNIYKSLDELRRIGDCYGKIAIIFYYQSDYPKALQYYNQGIATYKKIGFQRGLASSINNTGAIYYQLGNYPRALDAYKQAVQLDEGLNDKVNAASTVQNIGGIYLELEDYTNAMKYLQRARKTFESVSDENRLSQVLIGIGEVYSKQGDYRNALTSFEAALQLALKVDEKQRILESLFNHGKIYALRNDHPEAFDYYGQSLQLATDIENVLYTSRSLIAIGSMNQKIGRNHLALINCEEGLQLARDLKTVAAQEEACKCLYTTNKALNRNKIALVYYEQSIVLKDSLQAKQTANNILNMEFEKQMLKDSIAHIEKERKVQVLHEQALAKKEKQRNLLIVSGCFVLVFAGGLWSRLKYTKKARAILQVEKNRSEHLLLNILPEEIAEELKEKGYVDAQDFETASILFTDFKSFTETASKLSPQELVEEINVCFKAFDAIMDTYDIEKIKTIGDAYMAAGGLPKPDSKAVINTILAGLAMQEFTIKRKLKNTSQNKPAFDMRVGIHVGPIVAGIVGVKKFQYDIWGDTVNTASRMESNGAIGKVNISEDTYDLVKNQKDLSFEFRGKIPVKGKGELAMYFVSKTKC